MDTNKANELYEGEAIKIRGKEYIVPGLSLGQIERMADKIQSITESGDKLSKEMMATISEISHAALSRNYPDMTLIEVKDMLDMRNMKMVLEAVMGASGFVNRPGTGGTGAKGATLKRA